MMLMIHSTMAIQLPSSSHIPSLNYGDATGVNFAFPRYETKILRRNLDNFLNRRNGSVRSRIWACGKYLGSGSDQIGKNGKSGYHPLEEILDSETLESKEGRLTAAVTSRTITEVNNQASLMLFGLLNDEAHENIFWPDLPYLTDEHGNIYFQVNHDEDILQILTSEGSYLQVIIGLDAEEMVGGVELSGPTAVDFGIDGIEEDISFDEDDEDDDDNDFEGDWENILEVEEDQADSDESLGDWAKLDTMHSCHPMYFARRIAEVASFVPIDHMEQPPAGLAIQGILRSAFIEGQSIMHKHRSSGSDNHAYSHENVVEEMVEGVGIINGHVPESDLNGDNSVRTESEDLGKGSDSMNGTAFYKLEMIKMQLISANGHKISVDIDDYSKACPDAIAHSAAKIICRVNAAGEKTTNALKSLCWRRKGIQVEEASLISMDTLGFDMRVCSGAHVQTLRFVFDSQATSEYIAERQLNDLLFPRSYHKVQKAKQVQQKET